MIKRREAVSTILSDRANIIAVAGLGSPVYDVCAAGDHPLNFYNWGAMGSAVMVGLGLALSKPDRTVVVFTGDGEMLMGLGSLCTVAQHKPSNLHIVVLDNEQYAETGMQKTATGFGTDLAAVAAAVGFDHVQTLREQSGIVKSLGLSTAQGLTEAPVLPDLSVLGHLSGTRRAISRAT